VAGNHKTGGGKIEAEAMSCAKYDGTHRKDYITSNPIIVMNIEEYLQEHDDIILYRVLSEPDKIRETRFEAEKTVKELSKFMDISYNDLLALYKEASSLVFGGSKKYAIKTSEISQYTWGAKIADIVVVGRDERKTELAYIKELKKLRTLY
jgi:hypothetical protein